jgi:hypothetical protein
MNWKKVTLKSINMGKELLAAGNNLAAGSFLAAGSPASYLDPGIHLEAGSNQDQDAAPGSAAASYQEPAAAEIRVYGIDPDLYDGSILDLPDDQFQEEAEAQGLVWSLQGFQEAFNLDELSSNNLFIRFVTKK